MSVFAKRLKNGRSWCEKGITKLSDIMVTLMDGKAINTIQGELTPTVNIEPKEEQQKPPKHFVERLTKQAEEATRNNVAYLQQLANKPIFAALKGLRGF